MKKTNVLRLALVLFLVLALSPAALALDPSPDFYVTDLTGSLSRSTVQEIISLNAGLETKCDGAQFVVVFVDYFGDTDSDTYAAMLFNDWAISSNGMLLAVSPYENRGWLTTGEAIASRFTDKDAESYLNRYFWDLFDAGKYDKAVLKLADKLGAWYEKQYGVTFSDASSGSSQSQALPAYGSAGSLLWALLGFLSRNIFLVIFLGLVIWVLVQNDRVRYRSYYYNRGIPMPRYTLWRFLFGPHRRSPPRPSRPVGTYQRPGSYSTTYRPSAPRPSGSYRPSSPRPSGGIRPSGSSGTGYRPSGSPFRGSSSGFRGGSSGFRGTSGPSFRGGGGRSSGGGGGRR